MIARKRIAIMGATGYGGSELLRHLLFHPQVEVVRVTSRQHGGKPVSSVHPHLFRVTELAFEDADPVAVAKLSGVACLKDILSMRDHGASEGLSFLDCGYPSTAGMTDLAPMAKGIIQRLNRSKPDVIVIEMGDGIIGGYGVASVF